MQLGESTAPSSPLVRRAVIGATIGSVVEWFDVAVYGYLAAVIGQLFFPSENATVSLLSSFAVFGAAFVVRPLGGVFFGSLGDRIGRQRTLVAVLLLVSVSTFAVGLLPTYESIGIAAPALLVVCRLLQGFSAGGEMGGASIFAAEYAPPGRRGYLVSWVETGCIAGFLLGSTVVLVLSASLPDGTMTAWAWRIPFLVSAPLGLIGFYIRRRLEETPEFAALESTGNVAASPLRETFTQHWRAILQTAGFALVQNAGLYIILTYMPSYFSEQLGFSRTTASISATVTMIVIVVLIPPLGAVSDRIGRKRVLASSCVGLAACAYPLFALMHAFDATVATLAHIALGGLLAIFLSTTLVAMNELFTTHVRYGGFSIGYNISVSAFGGSAPFLVSLLIVTTGDPLSPAFYVIGAALITLAVIPTVRESAPRRALQPSNG